MICILSSSTAADFILMQWMALNRVWHITAAAAMRWQLRHWSYSNKHIRIWTIEIMNDIITGSDQWSFVALSLQGPFTMKFANESAMGESASELGEPPFESVESRKFALASLESLGSGGVYGHPGEVWIEDVVLFSLHLDHLGFPTLRCGSHSRPTRSDFVLLGLGPWVSPQTPLIRCYQPFTPTPRKPLHDLTVSQSCPCLRTRSQRSTNRGVVVWCGTVAVRGQNRIMYDLDERLRRTITESPFCNSIWWAQFCLNPLTSFIGIFCLDVVFTSINFTRFLIARINWNVMRYTAKRCCLILKALGTVQRSIFCYNYI
jgi:hypothetical protein